MNNYAYMFDEDYVIRHKKQHKLMEMQNFHYHGAYEILYVVKGKKSLVSARDFVDLTSGCIALIKPNEIHKTCDKEICEKITLYFTKSYLDKNFSEASQRLLLSCFKNSILRLDEAFGNELQKLFEAALNCKDKSVFFIHLGNILKKLSSYKPDYIAGDSTSTSKTADILKYIEKNYQSDLTIDKISAEFAVTKFHVCRLLQKEANTTVIGYLNAIRVQHLCNLLTQSSISVSECALRCGFHSPEYASRVFSSIMHISPGAYRKQKKEGAAHG